MVERVGRFLKDQPVLAIALIPILVLMLAAILAPWLPIADPNRGDILKRFLPPGADGHLLGTDGLGRDIFSRLIWGGRISITAGIAANILVTVIAVFLGLLAGSLGGKTDGVIMRLVDIGLAFPGLLLALAILSVLGQGVFNLVAAIALASIPRDVRFFRGEVLRVRHGKFVEAARLLGYGNVRIMFREILPNVMPLILTVTAAHATGFFVVTAGFSLLGLGIQPPTADWGSMIGEGIASIYEAPAGLIGPTLIITVLALSFNVMGDEVQRILSPKESQL
jgi:peptide/nickel transport system permease protein